MIRALVLRMRTTPFAILPGNTLALPTWRNVKQQRQNSSAQELKWEHDSERTSAMLHGKSAKLASASNHVEAPLGDQDPSSQHPQTKQQSQPPCQGQQGHQSPTEQESVTSKKREAAVFLNQRPAQRKRSNQLAPHPEIKDEAYIRRTMHIPTPEDYPNVSPKFFKSIRDSLNNATQGLAKLSFDFKDLTNDAFRCTLHYESAAHEAVVDGEGRSKKSAEYTAVLHLAAKLHQQGVLADVLDRDSSLNQINKKSIADAKQEARSAVMDIYNYAARYDTVPVVRGKMITCTKRGRLKKYVQVTADLSDQGIKVTATGSTPNEAEICAAQLFKVEAEKYHAERGSEAIVIKDSGALTTDNASKFFDFYKILRPGVDVRYECEEKDYYKDHGQAPIFSGQVMLNNIPLGEPVEMTSKKMVEDTAWLTAAIALKKQESDLYPRYLRALTTGNGQILRPIYPVRMPVDEACSLIMRETLFGARKAGLPDEVEEAAPMNDVSEAPSGGFHQKATGEEAERRDRRLQQQLTAYLEDPAHENLRKKKADLPMNQYGAKVIDIVNNNVYSIIVGATGSGKTTQVPQILLEDAITKGKGSGCNIICTQPRRIAATSVARRVAAERVERLQDTVGYRVRFDNKLPRTSGSITYCTTGILQQQLQHMSDDVMDNVSHLVIDEVHERDVLIDFLLILLKKNVARRLAQGKSVPRVILMSATMDTELFANYFKSDVAGKASKVCPSLSVPGRTFPVREKYLDEVLKEMGAASPVQQSQVMYTDLNSRNYIEAEDKFRNAVSTTSAHEASNAPGDEVTVIDWKRERKVSEDGVTMISSEKEDGLIPFGLTACTIAHIARTSQEGAILVFLPGLAEIVKVQELLQAPSLGIDFNDESKYRIVLLHSSIAASQNTVFDPVPEGCRKIILATNIAETSVTIPDVQYVVDTGKLREKQYDQTRRISQLVCTWISKSNAKQRAGRAGRVQNGNYYALYTKQRYESLRAIGLPELLRVDLQALCLQIRAQAFDTPIRDFLAEAIEPPAAKSVDSSVINLQTLDALTDDEAITPLGRLLSSLPVHPSLGKMIVLGIIFRCLDPMLVLGAASEERSLFSSPLESRREAQDSKSSFARGSGSDHIALLNAINELRRIRDEEGEQYARSFAFSKFLHWNAFKVIDATANQIEEILVEAGLIPYSAPNNRLRSQCGDPSLNENSHKTALIKALALAGFHPNLAIGTGGPLFRTPGEKNVMLHPSSVNAPKDKKEKINWDRGTLFSYSTMARSNDGHSIFLRETTQSTPLMATLFGGRLRRNIFRGNVIELDNWLPFYVRSSDMRTAKTIVEFRKALERLLATAFKDLGKGNYRLTQQGRGGGFSSPGASCEARQEEGRYLADEEVRRIFAGGLVDVLDQDVHFSQEIAKMGKDGGSKDSDEDGRDERRERKGVGPWGKGAERMRYAEKKRQYESWIHDDLLKF
ncbi:hypothetical protein N7G274_000626 [Stereocaulon virgatum]|uniref:RNA helicase n=1 Tax=Stereocaulon virgatum TaxID=373712 RepID=A0ABR4ASG3_9LECA